MARSFSDLVLPEDLIARLGPAANSGRSILLYGRAGNGKTAIAEALAGAFEDVIAVPHSIAIDGQIISFLDPHVHEQVGDDQGGESELRLSGGHDRRWVACRRPVTVVGGELTLDMLDLIHNPLANFYEAPAHLKVMGGVFVVDDFGRQRTSPESILNRWIVPLERGVDYLSLHTGKKFAVPFDGLVVFSTNLTPSDLADDAMLRRLYYKIEVPEPTVEAYARIWASLCARRDIPLPIDLVPFLERELYAKEGMGRAGYHPSYLLDQVAAMCDYQGRPLRLDKTTVGLACRNLCAR
jgi:energy-coupling factor transporter ATP-binding protein EcfA2